MHSKRRAKETVMEKLLINKTGVKGGNLKTRAKNNNKTSLHRRKTERGYDLNYSARLSYENL